MTDIANDLSRLVSAINELAEAYKCKPDGYFSINTLSASIMAFVVTNKIEGSFHDFIERECDRLGERRKEVFFEVQGHPV